MRWPSLPQLWFTPPITDHERFTELQAMDKVLDANPQFAELVHADPVRGIDPAKGRKGMTAEQVLRIFIVKQTFGFTYDELSFHLADSTSYRWFCHLAAVTELGVEDVVFAKSKGIEIEECGERGSAGGPPHQGPPRQSPVVHPRAVFACGQRRPRSSASPATTTAAATSVARGLPAVRFAPTRERTSRQPGALP